jgi:uncharacterized membrane protein YwzB
MVSCSRTSLVVAMIAVCLVYWSHRALRMQYFKHCNRDLIRIVMFDQSVVCSNVYNILNILEVACSQAIKNAALYVLGMIGAVATAMATATTSGHSSATAGGAAAPHPPTCNKHATAAAAAGSSRHAAMQLFVPNLTTRR